MCMGQAARDLGGHWGAFEDHLPEIIGGDPFLTCRFLQLEADEHVMPSPLLILYISLYVGNSPELLSAVRHLFPCPPCFVRTTLVAALLVCILIVSKCKA